MYIYLYVYQKNTPNTYGARVGHDAGESAVPIIDVPWCAQHPSCFWSRSLSIACSCLPLRAQRQHTHRQRRRERVIEPIANAPAPTKQITKVNAQSFQTEFLNTNCAYSIMWAKFPIVSAFFTKFDPKPAGKALFIVVNNFFIVDISIFIVIMPKLLLCFKEWFHCGSSMIFF